MLNELPVELKSEEFSNTINDLIQTYNIEEIIETGTCQGVGSTMVFAKTGLPVTSIECDPNNVETAKRNLKDYSKVLVRHGLSLKLHDMLTFLAQDTYKAPNNIRIDSYDPLSFYNNEINYPGIPENILPQLIRCPIKQLIFLDSAGGVGYLEYLEVMKLPLEFKHNKVLVMDDIDHVKHYRSVQELQNIWGYAVQISSDGRFGYVKI